MIMLRKAAWGVFVSSYFILVIVFLAASAATALNPSDYWWVGFNGLIYPFILLAVFLMTALMLFYRPLFSLFGILAMIMSYQDIGALIAFNRSTEFKSAKQVNNIRVMTWNIRRFALYYDYHFDRMRNNVDSVILEVNKYSPDIFCLQEFYSSHGKNSNNIEEIKRKGGFPYHTFSSRDTSNPRLQSGTIIFSKYPILRTYTYNLPKEISSTSERPVFADIVAGNDTIRMGTVHLESYGFLGRDYAEMSKIKNQEDKDLSASKKIFWKMRNAFSLRGKQVDIIRQKMEESTYPVIVCGDLNDVPNSYAYFKVRKNMKDAFLEKGMGLGKSYYSGQSRSLAWLPTLRIDYIFADPSFNISQFTMGTRNLSDHRAVITDVELPKK